MAPGSVVDVETPRGQWPAVVVLAPYQFTGAGDAQSVACGTAADRSQPACVSSGWHEVWGRAREEGLRMLSGTSVRAISVAVQAAFDGL